MRPRGRTASQIRPVTITRQYTCHAEGSVLVEFGNTKVLCNATVEEGVPRFMKGQGKGWITAEYSMLPRATHTRSGREAARGKQGGRTLEIQRLIARSLRAAVDLKLLGENTITLDCDVIQAARGTRTAAATGAWVALAQAVKWMQDTGMLTESPIRDQVAAISCGIYEGNCVLDLDYPEDSNADTDANFVMTGSGVIVEIQGTAEGDPFSEESFGELMGLAKKGIGELLDLQKKAVGV